MKLTKRLLALFLATVMLLSASPLAYAVGTADEEETEVIEMPAETEETTEEAEEMLPEEPAQTEPEEDTVPEETEEETEAPEEVPEEPEEPEEAEEPEESEEEETEPEEALPFGLSGMPEGYVLSDEEMAAKAALAEHLVPQTLAELTEGVDYAEGIVTLYTESEDYADLVAQAYNGTLVSYELGVAVIALEEISVLDAVTLAADPDVDLPAVSPDYIQKFVSSGISAVPGIRDMEAMAAAPKLESWYSQVKQGMSNPDPLIAVPEDSDYQWHHDVVNTYEAWGATTGSSSVRVAVISSGVDNSDGEISNLTIVNTGNGNFYSGDIGGTLVAKILAGQKNNGKGGAGIAPNVTVYSYNAVNTSGSYNTGNLATYIRDAASKNVKVIYIDKEFDVYNYTYDAAVQTAIDMGVTVIAPVGSDGTNQKSYPAAFNRVIGVAGTDRAGRRFRTSSYGAYADLCAPGEYITAAIGSDIWYYSGADPAAAITAGAAALYLSKLPDASPAQVEKALKSATQKAGESNIGGILDISKLFSGEKSAPKVSVFDAGNRQLNKSSLEEGETAETAAETGYKPMDDSGEIGFIGGTGEEKPSNPGIAVTTDGYFVIDQPKSNDNLLLYTIDGKNPSVLDGEVVYGTKATEGAKISLKNFDVGAVTIKAASVNGMGIISKITTVKLNISRGESVTGITVTAPSSMISGKSVTLSAAVTPVNMKQTVTWAITSRSGCSGARIDPKTGKLTTVAGQTGSVTVQATSAVKPSIKSSAVTISIKNGTPVSSVTLNEKTRTLHCYDVGSDETFTLRPTFLDSSKRTMSGVSAAYTTSNRKVATVSSSGVITAVAPGSATITCKAMDGSGKSATCKVTVKQGLDSVTISGQVSIAPGSSGTFKAVLNPSAVKGTKTEWSVNNSNVTVKNGKVSVPGYLNNTSFTLTASVTDGYRTRTATKTVYIRNKTTAVHVDLNTAQYTPWAWTRSGGWLKEATIYSTDAAEAAYGSSRSWTNKVQLKASFTGNSLGAGNLALWSSSAPAVATVDSNGMVTGHSAGTAKITVKANDGSNKSKSVTIKVINPASSLRVETAKSDVQVMNYDKPMASTAVLGDAYGKASVTKLSWDYSVYEAWVDSSGNQKTRDITSYVKNYRYGSITSSGKLTIKGSAYNLRSRSDSYLMASVTARTTDGTGLSATRTYEVRHPYTSIQVFGGPINIGTNTFRQVQTVTRGYDTTAQFTVKSSNPEIAGAIYLGLDPYGDPVIGVQSGTKTGTCKITLTSADSAKKSMTFTVKVG